MKFVCIYQLVLRSLNEELLKADEVCGFVGYKYMFSQRLEASAVIHSRCEVRE
jgi:hypothetical protein